MASTWSSRWAAAAIAGIVIASAWGSARGDEIPTAPLHVVDANGQLVGRLLNDGVVAMKISQAGTGDILLKADATPLGFTSGAIFHRTRNCTGPAYVSIDGVRGFLLPTHIQPSTNTAYYPDLAEVLQATKLRKAIGSIQIFDSSEPTCAGLNGKRLADGSCCLKVPRGTMESIVTAKTVTLPALQPPFSLKFP